MAAIVAANAATSVYLAYVVFLFTEWPVDETMAATLSAAGWLGLGARRLVYGTGVALLAMLVLFVVDRLLLAPALGDRAEHWARWLALGAAGLILLSSLGTSILVVVRRPVM